MEPTDTSLPALASAVPVLDMPITIALASTPSEHSEPDIYDGFITALSEHEALVEIPASEGAYESLQDTHNSVCISFKDHPQLPDSMLINILSINPRPPASTRFYTVHMVFANPSPQEMKLISKFRKSQTGVKPDDDELPSEVDIDTIRDLSSYIDAPTSTPVPSSTNQAARMRRPISISLPVNLAITFPEHSLRPIVRESRIITLNARGAMLEADLSATEYSSLLQTHRRCCIQFRNHPDLPESVNGKTVMIQPFTSDGRTRYRIGLVYHNIPSHAEKKLADFVETQIARETEGKTPIKSKSSRMEAVSTSTPPQQMRRRPRLRFPVPTKISIMLAEKAPTPYVYGGIVQDLSEYGAMVLSELSEETYQAILAKAREGSLSFGKSQPDLPESIPMRVIWVRPHQDESGKVKYKVGMSLKEAPPEAVQKVRRFVRKTLEESSGGISIGPLLDVLRSDQDPASGEKAAARQSTGSSDVWNFSSASPQLKLEPLTPLDEPVGSPEPLLIAGDPAPSKVKMTSPPTQPQSHAAPEPRPVTYEETSVEAEPADRSNQQSGYGFLIFLMLLQIVLLAGSLLVLWNIYQQDRSEQTSNSPTGEEVSVVRNPGAESAIAAEQRIITTSSDGSVLYLWEREGETYKAQEFVARPTAELTEGKTPATPQVLE